MIDQATELRQKMETERAVLAARRARPAMLAVAGGLSGVGATTVANQLAAAWRRAGRETLLPDAAGGESDGDSADLRLRGTSARAGRQWLEEIRRRVPRSHLVLFDLGAIRNEAAGHVWKACDQALLVVTGSDQAVMGAYSAIKRFHDADADAEIVSLVNQPALTDLIHAPRAGEVHRRLAAVCRQFLGIAVESVGGIPHFLELETEWAGSVACRPETAECFAELARALDRRIQARRGEAGCRSGMSGKSISKDAAAGLSTRAKTDQAGKAPPDFSGMAPGEPSAAHKTGHDSAFAARGGQAPSHDTETCTIN